MIDGHRVVITARDILTLGATLGVLAACGGGKSSSGSTAAAAAPTRVKVDCPPRSAQVKPDSQATLTIALRAEPALAPGAAVNLRLMEETTQSTHKLDPAQPSSFALRAGVYVLRVGTKGYKTVEGQATLTAGCEITMTIDLRASD